MGTTSVEQVRAWRLKRHRLTGRADPSALVATVAELGGVQAQLASAAELAIEARVDGVGPADVRRALWDDRTLVKTWTMRGTLHLHAAATFPSWVAASRLRAHFLKPYWLAGFGITLDEMRGILEAVPVVLDGCCLSREELADALGERLGAHIREKLRSGWGSLLKPCAFQGLLCFGPSRGQNVTFVRPDQWLPDWHEVETPEEAQRTVLRSYLRTYGPARPEDFGHWWGIMQPKELREWWKLLADELVEVDVAGRQGWLHQDDVAELTKAPPASGLRLVPHFDAYVYGAAPREHVIAANLAPRVFRPQGWISPVLLIDGAAAGVWEQERKGRRVLIRVEPFSPLSTEQRALLEEEVARLGTFLGAAPELTVA